MKYDNSTSWGNGPRKVVRDYLNHWYSNTLPLENIFGLSVYCDRYYLIEELNELCDEETVYDSAYLKELYCREIVRDFLNRYTVSEKNLIKFFNIVRIGSRYFLKEDISNCERSVWRKKHGRRK